MLNGPDFCLSPYTLLILCLMAFHSVWFLNAACQHQGLSENIGLLMAQCTGRLPSVYIIFFFHSLQLYVPDEDKSIFGRSVNKQVFEGLTTGLLQTVATVLGSLWPHISESGQGEKTRISSPDAKVKSSATESFNTRTHDLIRYFPSNTLLLSHCFSSSYMAPLFLISWPFYLL